MKHSLPVLLLAGILLVPVTASVQASGAAAAAAMMILRGHASHQQLVRFHSFLQAHPDTAGALEASPKSVKDSVFLAAHDDLRTYLQADRSFARKLKAHPKAIMTKAQKLK